jgi:hypothetical protein
MASAEEIATLLAYEFLRTGRYSASTGPVEMPSLAIGAVGAEDEDFDDVVRFRERAAVTSYNVEGFSGLAVQSVGYEEGPADPAVHLYLTRGAVKQMKALPDQIDGVPVKVHRMGPITVRPEAMASSTNRGNIFELNNRICCGSSCGPTSERGAGTLGAIVKIGNRNDLFLLSNNHVLSGCNHVPHNQPILAPASMDGRPDAIAPHEIGRHHMLHELRSGDPHFVVPGGIDLALGRVSDPASICSWQGDAADGYDTPGRIAEPVSLMRVKEERRALRSER